MNFRSKNNLRDRQAGPSIYNRMFSDATASPYFAVVMGIAILAVIATAVLAAFGVNEGVTVIVFTSIGGVVTVVLTIRASIASKRRLEAERKAFYERMDAASKQRSGESE